MNNQDSTIPSNSPDLQTKLAQELQKLAPEIMADGKIDVQKLQELLDTDATDATGERFGLVWPGKKMAQRAAQLPTSATLVPAKDESKDWDTTQNVYIEGDNLEVLKVLQRHYHNKVKMIYIDPPYNTGKDFVYKDNYKDNLKNYLEFSGQTNEDGKATSTNTDANGRYHSNWLNMIYPRLKLARNLLTDDGVIFISIDDNEASHLRKVCDEIFGEDNFICNFLWNKSQNPPSLSKIIRHKYENVICYKKKDLLEGLNGGTISGGDSPIFNGGNNVSELLLIAETVTFNMPDGHYKSGKRDLIELLDDVEVENGVNKNNFRLKGQFRWIQETLNQELRDGTTLVIKSDKFAPRYSRPGERTITPSDVISMSENKVDTNERGRKELEELDLENIFDFPKPTSLIKYLTNLIIKNDEEEVIIDFFSGSGTTAHAVMQLNAEDNGNRKYVQVQLPESTRTKNKNGQWQETDAYKAGYKTIADIGKERIRRAGEKIKQEYAEQIAKRETPLDIGFRVYKLADTNFTKWQVNSDATIEELQTSLLDAVENITSQATEESLLTELLLKLGYSLSSDIKKIEVSGLMVWSVTDGALLAYTAVEKPTLEQLRALVAKTPEKLVILDRCFAGDDELKTNLAQLCNTNNIELRTA